MKPGVLTPLLARWSEGDASARDQAMALAYGELLGVARRMWLAFGSGQTLEPTALVHELHLRLTREPLSDCQHHAQFFAAATATMRRVVIDALRAKYTKKRGAGRASFRLDEARHLADAPRLSAEVLVSLDGALQRLAKIDPRKAEVVELRFFAGMTNVEVAATLGLGRATVEREWTAARRWLQATLGDDLR